MRAAIILFVVIAAFPARAGESRNPEPVEIVGYRGQAMAPFISRDGRYLLFNNLNDPSENTDLHWAGRIAPTSFRYSGKIEGVNTKALEGVPTLDRKGSLHFVSSTANRPAGPMPIMRVLLEQAPRVPVIRPTRRDQPNAVDFASGPEQPPWAEPCRVRGELSCPRVSSQAQPVTFKVGW
jgi:hypothetical protein